MLRHPSPSFDSATCGLSPVEIALSSLVLRQPPLSSTGGRPLSFHKLRIWPFVTVTRVDGISSILQLPRLERWVTSFRMMVSKSEFEWGRTSSGLIGSFALGLAPPTRKFTPLCYPWSFSGPLHRTDASDGAPSERATLCSSDLLSHGQLCLSIVPENANRRLGCGVSTLYSGVRGLGSVFATPCSERRNSRTSTRLHRQFGLWMVLSPSV